MLAERPYQRPPFRSSDVPVDTFRAEQDGGKADTEPTCSHGGALGSHRMRLSAAEGLFFCSVEFCPKAPPNVSSACTDPSNRSACVEQLHFEVELT